MGSFHPYIFPQNRFDGLRSSQTPPASVGVKSNDAYFLSKIFFLGEHCDTSYQPTSKCHKNVSRVKFVDVR